MKKTTLITGASTGIGTALADVYAKHGYDLILMARRGDKLNEIKARLESLYSGIAVSCVVSDVSNTEKHREDIRTACAGLSTLNVAIANAGIGGVTNGWMDAWEKASEILTVNILGAVATLETCKMIMLKQGFGHLVGITSVASARGLPQSSAYCASKAALEVYLESLRIDLSNRGIEVTAIHPGFVSTPMTEKNGKMPFLITPEDAAQRIYHGVEKHKARVFFPAPMAMAVWLLRRIPNTLYDSLMSFGRKRAQVFRKKHEEI